LKRKQQQQQQFSESKKVSSNDKNIMKNDSGSSNPKHLNEVVLMAEYEDLNIRREPTAEETLYQQLAEDNYENVHT